MPVLHIGWGAMGVYGLHRRPLDVLIVDDVPDIRFMLRTSLRHQDGIGHVAEAAGGLEALAMIRERRPDVVVLDLRMPDIDGMETARRIKSVCPEAKIILFSAFLEDAVYEQAAESGIDLCLAKTTVPSVVADMMRTLCVG